MLLPFFVSLCFVVQTAAGAERCNSRWQEVVVRHKWGYLFSPNYGHGYYPPSDTCYWLLTAANSDRRIRVSFQAFELERHQVGEPCKDFVSFYDGRRETAPILGKFCGDRIPRNVISSGRSLLVKFSSDNHKEYAGFRLVYEAIPNRPNVESSVTWFKPPKDDANAMLNTLRCAKGEPLEDLVRSAPDEHITASSAWKNHPPWLAKLDNKASALAACCWAVNARTDEPSFIQVELKKVATISAIVTQGSDVRDEWVTSYRIEYLLNGDDFTYYKTRDGKIQLFRGNRDANTKVANILEPPIRARFIRLIPQSSHRWK